jgi:hypothetical protein
MWKATFGGLTLRRAHASTGSRFDGLSVTVMEIFLSLPGQKPFENDSLSAIQIPLGIWIEMILYKELC